MSAKFIGNIPVRLREDNVADEQIRYMLDHKEDYDCRTEVQLIKKALLYYKHAHERENLPRHEEVEKTDPPLNDANGAGFGSLF